LRGAQYILSRTMPLPKSAPHVHKFGGASLADAAAIGQAVAIVRSYRPEPAVVVVSAMAGATDALLAVAGHAVRGEATRVRELIAALRAKYGRAARAVVPPGRARTTLLDYVRDQFDELAALGSGLGLLRDLSPRTSDFILARGERLSARLVAAALAARGVRARFVDATGIVRTDFAPCSRDALFPSCPVFSAPRPRTISRRSGGAARISLRR
jgi:aspartokinase